MKKDRLITLAIHTYPKALILKGILESQGIAVAIQNVNLLKPVISPGVRVRIHEKDLPHALEILETDPVFGKSEVSEKPQKNRILIPIDFSDYSLLACRLGFDFSEADQAEVVLLHTFLSPFTMGSLSLAETISHELKESEEHKLLFAKANREMTSFCEKLHQLMIEGAIPQVPFIYRVCEGVPEDTIILMAKELNPSLIVMGSRGKTRKEIDLIGSVTAEVVDNGSFPVFAIPEGFKHTHVSDIKNVAFFTNFDQQDLISLDTFMRLFQNYSFGIRFFHLTEKSDAWTEIKLAGIRDYCQSHYPGREIDYKILGEENFLDNVERLFQEASIDVMVVPNRKRNIFARLFNPSIAHKMLFHTDTPLIAIPS